MSRTPEQIIQLTIGQLYTQLAVLTSENERLKEELTKLKPEELKSPLKAVER